MAVATKLQKRQAPPTPTPSETASDDSTLRDAGEANREQEAESTDATRLELAESAEIESVTVTIKSAEWGETFDSGGVEYRDLMLDVRFTNPGEEDAESPLLVAVCSNRSAADAANQHEGPIDVFEPLPAGTQAEGPAVISVELPCEPGWLEWDPKFDGTGFRWPMPALP